MPRFWDWRRPIKRLFPGVVWLVPLLLFVTPPELCMLASAVLLHEGGHLLAFAALGLPPPRPAAVSAGLMLTPRMPLSYRHEALVAAAGPLANLALAIPLLYFGRGEGAAALGSVQLFCAAVNLLPLRGGDGGRTARAVLLLLLPPRVAERLADALSLFTVFFLLFALLYLLLSPGGAGIFLFLITLLQRATVRTETPL